MASTIGSPIFQSTSGENELRQRLLVANLWVIMATIIVSALLILPQDVSGTTEILLGLIPYGAFNSVALLLAYRGHVKLSAALYSSCFFTLHGTSLFLLRELPPHMLLAMVNFIILNGVVLGGPAALVTTLLTATLGLGCPELGTQYEATLLALSSEYNLDLSLSDRVNTTSLLTTTFETGFLVATTLRLQTQTRRRLRDTLVALHDAQSGLEKRRDHAEQLASLGNRLAAAQTKSEVEDAVSASLKRFLDCTDVVWSDTIQEESPRSLRFGSGPSARWLSVDTALLPDERASIQTIAELRDAAIARINSVERVSLAARLEGVGRLAASIAHDFNNLLVPISAAHEILDLEPVLSDRAKQMVDRSRAASAQATALIAKLLTHSRSTDSVSDVFDIRSRIIGMSNLLQGFLPRKVHFEPTLPDHEVWVKMDPVEFEQIVLNLLLNARDAAGPEGRIWLTLTSDGGWATMTVDDDGPGIPPDLRKWILEPFHTTRGEGTGLGLATVNRIVNHLGGRLHISEHASGGASIQIVIPLEKPSSSVPTSPPDEPAETPARALKVLVIDDDEAVAHAMAEILRILGHEAHVTVSARQALDKLDQTGTYDLILSDFQMQHSTGIELLAMLRAKQVSTPFIIVSGYGASIPSCADHEPDEILRKPVELADLRRITDRYT